MRKILWLMLVLFRSNDAVAWTERNKEEASELLDEEIQLPAEKLYDI